MLILKNTVTPKTVEVLLPILDCFSNNKESLEICVSEVLSRVTEMTGTNDMISILESVNAETFEITTEEDFKEFVLFRTLLNRVKRMFAMKNANDSAKEILDELTLYYNQVRQSAITAEIAEIVGGAAAMS